MADTYAEWMALRDDTDVLAQQMEAARALVSAAEASDDTGEVTVRVDAGGSVEAVRVGFAWDRALRPEDLGPTVLATVGAARMAQTEQYGRALEQMESQPAPDPRPAPAATDPVGELARTRALLTGLDDADAAAEVFLDVLGQAADGIDEANRIIEQHAEKTFTGRSKHVRATFSSSGDLQALDLESTWVRGAHPTNLGREITLAITDGAQRVRREGLTAALQASQIARVALLATDPTASLDL